MEAVGVPHFDPVPTLPARGSKGRRLAFVAGFALFAAFFFAGPGANPAFAQSISLLRDTETEDMLNSYEAPLAKAAGLQPGDVHMYLVGDPEVNAFAAEGREHLHHERHHALDCKTPNELIGVMAHETGHIAAGHISRSGVGMEKAMIPMLLSMVLGVAAMIAGAGEAGMVIMGVGQAMAQAQMAAFTRVQESTADQIALKLLLPPINRRWACTRPSSASPIEAGAERLQDRSRLPSTIPSARTRLADIEDRRRTPRPIAT